MIPCPSLFPKSHLHWEDKWNCPWAFRPTTFLLQTQPLMALVFLDFFSSCSDCFWGELPKQYASLLAWSLNSSFGTQRPAHVLSVCWRQCWVSKVTSVVSGGVGVSIQVDLTSKGRCLHDPIQLPYREVSPMPWEHRLLSLLQKGRFSHCGVLLWMHSPTWAEHVVPLLCEARLKGLY